MKKYLFISLIFLHSLTTLSDQDESLELLYKKIERLELEIQDLRNLLEENSILVDRSLELQQQRYLDLDARLLELSKLIELETPSQAFNHIEVRSEEMGLYKDALSLFENSRFAEALEKFTEIIISFPDGSYASDSYFWSGELFLAQNMYEDAKINFETFFSFAAFTNGSNASRFIDLPSDGFNSKLGSFDIQAKCIKVSCSIIDFSNSSLFLISPFINFKFS